MKPAKRILPFVLSFLIGLLVLSGCATVGGKTPAGVSSTQEKAEGDAGSTYIKGMILKEMKGKEQMAILLSDVPDFDISRESDNALMINLRGVSIPEGMKKEYSGGKLKNIKAVSLYQETTDGGKETFVRVLLRRMVPYRYSKAGAKIVIDFNVSTLSYRTAADTGYSPKVSPAPAPKTIAPASETIRTTHGKVDPHPEKDKQYTGEEISLDFQDADIKSVFRLISEISGFSIVAGPDVKTEITVHMKDIAWDQALDTILEVNGLGKKQSGKVITVLSLEKLKKAEEEQQKRNVAQGRLKQIAIEAKIVEVTTSFARELGIKWGYGYKDRLGEKDYGVMIGNSASGDLTPLPGGIGLTSSSTAVNFPSVSALASPALGLVIGTSKFILDAQLQAMETNGDGKVISSPKITTLDGEEAKISQGKEIPYLVPATGDEPAHSDFKEVVLELKVTPTITPDGRISLDIYATNKELDWANAVLGMPAIDKSDVDSKIVVKNGDTVVVGGIYKTIETDGTEGVPWLSEIPVLGWLFKTESRKKQKRELLIFVTPNIIGEDG
jgi:type IV pilus assembly protein PilQ